jgi:hypothetical protein
VARETAQAACYRQERREGEKERERGVGSHDQGANPAVARRAGRAGHEPRAAGCVLRLVARHGLLATL